MQKFDISHSYQIDLWDEGVYDRKGLDIAWICACLNPLRYRIERNMNLFQKNFKLSPFYILFFHLYDRSCFFIDRIISSRMLPISDAKVQNALRSPVSYLGNWNDFSRIVLNRGVVPLHAMVGGEIHAHRPELITVLSNCLAYHAALLRNCDDGDVPTHRATAVSAVSDILIKYLGKPPETFDWNYKNADGEDCSLEKITPLDFYKNYCGDYDVGSRVIVFDECLKGKVPEEEGKTFFRNSADLGQIAAWNLSITRQMVVVGADTRQQSNKMLGILDLNFTDNESSFGSDVSMSKKDSVDYHRIAVTDYLTLDGVQWRGQDDLTPLRFKAQDSCGADTGADGHYTMSFDWFKEYALFVVVSEHFLG